MNARISEPREDLVFQLPVERIIAPYQRRGGHPKTIYIFVYGDVRLLIEQCVSYLGYNVSLDGASQDGVSHCAQMGVSLDC